MPNRVLRDWTTSEVVDNLSQGAEVFFTRLIMKADDYGSFYANPKLIRSALFPLKPYKDKQIQTWIEECLAAKLLISYDVEGKSYIRIENFGQRLRNMRNTFPQPDGDPLTTRGNSRPETKQKRNETEEETEGTFEERFLRAFDSITCEGYQIAFKGVDLGAELQKFKVKCDNEPDEYHGRKTEKEWKRIYNGRQGQVL